jgi:pimeloyl-ACP methyl ester carboxylesterase
MRALLFGLCSLVLASCAALAPAPIPMRAIDHPRTSEEPARCLLVLLPGMGDSAEDFTEHAFVSEVRKRNLSIDIVAAEATFGYYAKGIFPKRLHDDVVAPRMARATKPYAEIWLAGVSMGGMGTMLYARERPPGEVTGTLAIAPYMGEDELVESIYAAGGLATWRPPARVDPLTEDTWQGELWRYVQAVSQGKEEGPLLHLAYGIDDRLARADALLAAVLPKPRVYVGPGEHKWTTWQKLFIRFLDESELKTRCK